MYNFIWIGGITLGSLLLIAGLLHLIPRLGSFGKTLSNWLCIAPGLDLVVGFFTALPLILGPVFGGWVGLAASVCGQVLAVMIWTTLHGLAHPKARKGPRIVNFLNALVGPWRNFHRRMDYRVCSSCLYSVFGLPNCSSIHGLCG